MFAETGQRLGSFGRTGTAVWVAGLAAVLAAGLLAAPVSAKAPPAGHTVFVHSAPSGELGGGRVTLHSVGRRVTWAHESGRSGALPVRQMHRLVFSSGRPFATGTLHVAGHRGGDELTFKLTRPRYNAARHTVSYKVKRLGNGHLPGRGARAAQDAQRFRAASLSIVAAPQTAPLTAKNTYYECYPYGGSVPNGCWGTVTASGMQPNQDLTVTVTDSNGQKNPGDPPAPRTDANGNLDVYQLDLLCFGDVSVDISGVAADGTTVTAHADGPVYYNGPDPVCSNQGP